MKILQKWIILFFLSGFLFFSSVCVIGWFTVYRVIDITITDVSEPYLIELLYPIDSAPILSEEEITSKLTEVYNVSSFVDSMNGYIDEEGYGSSKLYSDVQCLFTASGDDQYTYSYSSEPPTTYKMALIFEDGTVTSTRIITQSLISADISFDGEMLSFEEFYYYQNWALDSPISWTYYFTKAIFQLVLILAMMAVELTIFFLFGFKGKKSYFKMGLLYLVFFLFSYLMQQIREETMSNPSSFFFPYLAIFIIALITVVESKVLRIKHRDQSPFRTFIYVVFANAFLIVFSIWTFQSVGGFW